MISTNECINDFSLIAKNNIIADIDQAFLDFSGFSYDELVNLSFDEIWHDYLRINSNPNSIVFPHETFLFTKNLEAKEVSVSRSEDRRSGDIKYTFQENSNSKLENKFTYIEQFYKTDKMAVSILHTEKFTILKANDKFLSVFDEPFNKKSESLGKSLSEICMRQLGNNLSEILNAIIDSQEPYFNKRFIFDKASKDQRYWDITITPVLFQGKVKYLIITANEITELVEIENSIFHKKEQLEQLFENINEGIYITDNKGNFVMVNAEGRRQLYQPDSVSALGEARKTTRYFDLSGNEISKARMPGFRALNGEKVRDEKLIYRRPDKELYVNVSATPIYDENGSIKSVAVTTRDITEEHIMEKSNAERQRALLVAEKEKNEALKSSLAMKEDFLTTITHEFKTPLSVILSALQTIEAVNGSQLTESLAKNLNRIKKNTYRQLRLVNNLLDLSKYDAGHLKMNFKNRDIVSLTNAIIKSIDFYADQKGVKLYFSSSVSFKIMAIDEEKYDRILLNLLSNAIKFTPRGKSVYVNISCNKRKVIISVEDEGIGIPKSKQAVIFERFEQVDSSLSRLAEGTGIGLTLVKALVTEMNGEISVDSSDIGSVFTIKLPISKTKQLESYDFNCESQYSRIVQAITVEFSDIY